MKMKMRKRTQAALEVVLSNVFIILTISYLFR